MRSLRGLATIGVIMLVVLGALLGGFFLIGPALSGDESGGEPPVGAASALVGEPVEAASEPTPAPVARISLAPVSLTISEPAGSASFRLTLSSEPEAPVLIPLSVSNEHCRALPQLVTVDQDTWQEGVEVIVTAVDDSVAEGAHSCEVQLSAASSIAGDYNGKTAGSVTVDVVDDDTAGVVVSPSGLEVSEPDGKGTLAVTFTSQPTGAVTVALASSNAECAVSPEKVVLGPGTWLSGAPVTVTAVDDAAADGTVQCMVETAISASQDPVYEGLSAEKVVVAVADNDRAALVVKPTTLTVSEPAGSTTILFRLTSAPLSPVIVPLSASGDCSVSPTQAVLDSANWNTGVRVTAAAIDDAVVDGSQPCEIAAGTAGSEDPAYRGLAGDKVTLTVADNDRAGIAVAPSSLAVSEPAGTGTFRVTLTSEPSAGVTLSLAATSGECSVSPAAVSLDASNWRDGVQVTVTAVDDTVVDGATTCAVAAQPSASEAAEYRGLEAPGVAVAVADDDQAGVLVSSGSLTLLEVGETGTISVRLSSQPAAPVVVSIASDGQLLVSPPQVVFAPENWAQEQQFSVQVTDDTVAQGPRTAVLSLQLSSNDLTFTGLAPTNVAVAIEDNDAAGIMVSPPELDLVMGGPAGSYSLQLATQPASAVTVTLSYAAPLQPTPSILSFGAANWKEPRTVSVSVAPAAVQGDLVGTISHSVLSADPAYAQLRVADVTVRVAEGEAAAEADGKPAGAASAVGSAPTRFVLPQIRFSSGAMMGVLVVGLVTIAMGIEFLRTR